MIKVDRNPWSIVTLLISKHDAVSKFFGRLCQQQNFEAMKAKANNGYMILVFNEIM